MVFIPAGSLEVDLAWKKSLDLEDFAEPPYITLRKAKESYFFWAANYKIFEGWFMIDIRSKWVDVVCGESLPESFLVGAAFSPFLEGYSYPVSHK